MVSRFSMTTPLSFFLDIVTLFSISILIRFLVLGFQDKKYSFVLVFL